MGEPEAFGQWPKEVRRTHRQDVGAGVGMLLERSARDGDDELSENAGVAQLGEPEAFGQWPKEVQRTHRQDVGAGVGMLLERSARDGDAELSENAGVAQLVEQLICNQPVVGSNPIASSIQTF